MAKINTKLLNITIKQINSLVSETFELYKNGSYYELVSWVRNAPRKFWSPVGYQSKAEMSAYLDGVYDGISYKNHTSKGYRVEALKIAMTHLNELSLANHSVSKYGLLLIEEDLMGIILYSEGEFSNKILTPIHVGSSEFIWEKVEEIKKSLKQSLSKKTKPLVVSGDAYGQQH